MSSRGCASQKRPSVTFTVTWSRAAKRALHSELPESVAAACTEFVLGPLAENPHRVGKPLRGDLEGLHSARRGAFRIIYRIDEGRVTIYNAALRHRRDAYR